MKQQWTGDELAEHWTLTSDEFALLKHKSGKRRLSFCLMLKFFHYMDRFPAPGDKIPFAVIGHVAAQAGVESSQFSSQHFSGETAGIHREEIRRFLGIRKHTLKDSEELIAWLAANILPDGDWSMERLTMQSYEHFKELKVEPFSPDRIERNIRSALTQFEDRFFADADGRLEDASRGLLDELVGEGTGDEPEEAGLADLKQGSGGVNLESILEEIRKLGRIQAIGLPGDLFAGVSPRILKRYAARISAEPPNEIRAHHHSARHAMLAVHCHLARMRITDELVELLIQVIHKIGTRAEAKIDKEFARDAREVVNKQRILYEIALNALAFPEGAVREVIYPVAGESRLRSIVDAFASKGSYQRQVQDRMRLSYGHHHRRMLAPMLKVLVFRTNNANRWPLIAALRLMSEFADSNLVHYPCGVEVPMAGVAENAEWRKFMMEKGDGPDGPERRVNRINYEMGVLRALRAALRCKDVWVEGAGDYRNPDEDLPADFEARREDYYKALGKPLDANEFIAALKERMHVGLETLDKGMPSNRKVSILKKGGGWISVSPLGKQDDPPNITRLKKAIKDRWPMTILLDILKETDFRTGICSSFETSASRLHIDHDALVRRLLLCLFAYGTNTGLKRASSGNPDIDYQALRYVRRRFMDADRVRNAIVKVVDAVFDARAESVWGEATTACAADSTKFGSWDQNLMTEWHVRYRGPGVMIYWHVERKSVCIHSQLKRCSSSEVASMIGGVLNHCTRMDVGAAYVDSHGQSEPGFAFSHMLDFDLLPRLKAIHRQKLSRPEAGASYSNLKHVMRGPIKWDLIFREYDQIVKYTTALRLGTATPEALLRRFTRGNARHPVYKAILELGKACKTIFLCRYLHSEELRREIHEGLNVVENWNSGNSQIFYGKSGEFSSNSKDEQEMSMLCLHLLQVSVVYINTLMIQSVLARPEWKDRLTDVDRRALCPLLFEHIHPYGLFPLDLNIRLNIEEDAA
jgi:TnpA family transposase